MPLRLRFATAVRAPIDLLIAAAAVAALFPVWLLPWRIAARLGWWYGVCAGLAQPTARRASMINLRRAYGHAMTRARARRITWAVFGHLGQSMAEGIKYGQWARGPRRIDPVRWDYGSQDVRERAAADPRPKIFMTGHLGSWEVATIAAGLQGGSGAAVARRIDNRFLDGIVGRLRLPPGFEIIEKRGASAEALARLRAGQHVAILADENAGPRGVFVDYFNRPASTTRLPALLALMTGSPVILGAALRMEPDETGRPRFLYRLAWFEPPSEARGIPAGVRDLTQQVTREYERWVREAPEQWRWVHWRWKTRPGGAKETYTPADVNAVFGDRPAGMRPFGRRREVPRTPGPMQ